MSDMSWMNNPALKNMNPKKLEIIMELARNAEGKSMNQALPLLMTANQKLKQDNMNFTPEESGILMAILTKDMSPSEKNKVKAMKEMMNKNKK